MTLRIVVAIIASYLLGAIPTSQIVARMKGINLRNVGSGNLGATNLYRVLGLKFALPVGIFDAFKGAIPVAVFGPWAGVGVTASLLLGAIAVVGHVFPVFASFKGGKGVATSAGVVLGLAPAAFGASLALWGIILAVSGYVSLASIAAALVMPAAVWLLQPSRRGMVAWFAVIAIAVVWLHRGNLRRLRNGTERRVGSRAEALPPDDPA